MNQGSIRAIEAKQEALRKARIAAEAARQAASYTGRSIQEWNNKHGLGGSPARTTVTGSPSEKWGPSVRIPQVVNRPAVPAQSPSINPQMRAITEAYQRAATNFQRQKNRPSVTQSNIAEIQRLVPRLADGQSFLTPTQIDQMINSPYAGIYDAMLGQGGLKRIGEVGERLGFNQVDPLNWTIDAQGNRTPMEGFTDEYGFTNMRPEGVDALREAMWLAGVQMEQEGYKISEPELQNAIDSGNDIYKPGDTLFDVAQRQGGGESYEEMQQSARDADLQARKDEEAAINRDYTMGQRENTLANQDDDYYEGLATQMLQDTFGIVPTIDKWSSQDVAGLISDPDNQQVMQAALALMAEYKNDGMEWEDVELALKADPSVALDRYSPEGAQADRAMLEILRQLY